MSKVLFLQTLQQVRVINSWYLHTNIPDRPIISNHHAHVSVTHCVTYCMFIQLSSFKYENCSAD